MSMQRIRPRPTHLQAILEKTPAQKVGALEKTPAQKAAATLLALMSGDSDLSDGVRRALGLDNATALAHYLSAISSGESQWGNSNMAPLMKKLLTTPCEDFWGATIVAPEHVYLYTDTYPGILIPSANLADGQVPFYTLDHTLDQCRLFERTDKLYLPEEAKLLNAKIRRLEEAIHAAQAIGLDNDKKFLGARTAAEQPQEQKKAMTR